jgi:hypothetical protein
MAYEFGRWTALALLAAFGPDLAFPEPVQAPDRTIGGVGRKALQKGGSRQCQQGAIGDRLFRIEFLDPGARAYAFTFG